jgi:hypothetical protein
MYLSTQLSGVGGELGWVAVAAETAAKIGPKILSLFKGGGMTGERTGWKNEHKDLWVKLHNVEVDPATPGALSAYITPYAVYHRKICWGENPATGQAMRVTDWAWAANRLREDVQRIEAWAEKNKLSLFGIPPTVPVTPTVPAVVPGVVAPGVPVEAPGYARLPAAVTATMGPADADFMRQKVAGIPLPMLLIGGLGAVMYFITKK